MQGLFRVTITALAALLGFSLFALTQSATATADDAVAGAKREDSATVLLSEDDDDDDDDSDETGESSPSGTGVSHDGTGSRVTSVSRDRDISRGDLTKDWTMDGGDPTRDFSQNHTDDASRNDTR